MSSMVASQRSDGRGHWPAGKRRSPITRREQRAAVSAVRRLARAYGSYNQAADAVGVAPRTLRRIATSEDWPLPETVELISIADTE